MTGSDVNRELPEALRGVESVVLRARSALARQSCLDGAARGFFPGAVVAALAIVIGRLAGLSPGQAWWLLLVALAGAVLGSVLGKTAVPDGYRVAKRIDEQLGLKDRLAGGYDLLRRARTEDGLPRTSFTALMLSDAARAAKEAERSLCIPVHVPKGLVHGALCLVFAAALSLLVLPGGRADVTGLEVSREQREQVRAFNESLARMAATIQAMEGLDDEQEKAMLDALRAIQIGEDELRKMTRADIIRRLREANAKIKVPEGVQAAAFRRAVEDQMRAIAEMEQVQRQLAEIEAINQREAVIDLGDGRTTSAANIPLESSDLHIDEAIAAVTARPGEAELEYQRRVAAAEARTRAEQEKIKRFLAKTIGTDLPETEARKLAALLASDVEFQGRVMEAIKDPTSKQFDAMREIYRRQLEREFERENIPRGLRQQLSTYLGR
ncbi:MAG TPA: hypothetical protein VMZ92_03065 [Planctomycetota bacterium]|nr:hypothetical protein [Planctomycetota bacterium]